MAVSKQELAIIISAYDEASGTFKKVNNEVGGLGDTLKTVGKYAAVAMAAASAAALAFGKSAVDSFNESEKTAAQLDAVLKSTAGAAGITRDAALSLASALQKQTTFSDEAVLSAENMLLTFTNIKDDVFPDATKTVLDMSTALGQDTKSSAIQLGKALNDPIQGVTALQRVGVNFTDKQKDQIEAMVKSGKTMEAQKFILKELATEFGGSASAQVNTFDGKMQQLKNSFDDFKEVVGETIVKHLTPFIAKLGEFVAALPTMLAVSKSAFVDMKASIAGVFSDTNMYWVFVKDFFVPLWVSVKETVIKAWNDIANAIKPIMPELEMMAKYFGIILVGAIMVLVTAIATIIKVVVEITTGIIKMFSGAIQVVEGLFGALFSMLLGDSDGAIESLKKAWNGLKEFFSGLWETIFAAFKPAMDPVISAINSLISGYNKVASKVGKSEISEIRLSGRATGGSVMSGNSYIVGENGPEVFTPSGSGSIQNSVSGSKTITVNFNNVNVRNDQDLDSIVDAVKRTLNRENELIRIGAY